MTETEDARMSEETFKIIVDELLSTFNLLHWIWLGAPGAVLCTCLYKLVLTGFFLPDRPTDSDQFLTTRLDLLHSGVLLKARHLMVQYGDGDAILTCWKDMLYWYNKRNKVIFIFILINFSTSTESGLITRSPPVLVFMGPRPR